MQSSRRPFTNAYGFYYGRERFTMGSKHVLVSNITWKNDVYQASDSEYIVIEPMYPNKCGKTVKIVNPGPCAFEVFEDIYIGPPIRNPQGTQFNETILPDGTSLLAPSLLTRSAALEMVATAYAESDNFRPELAFTGFRPTVHGAPPAHDTNRITRSYDSTQTQEALMRIDKGFSTLLKDLDVRLQGYSHLGRTLEPVARVMMAYSTGNAAYNQSSIKILPGQKMEIVLL